MSIVCTCQHRYSEHEESEFGIVAPCQVDDCGCRCFATAGSQIGRERLAGAVNREGLTPTEVANQTRFAGRL